MLLRKKNIRKYIFWYLFVFISIPVSRICVYSVCICLYLFIFVLIPSLKLLPLPHTLHLTTPQHTAPHSTTPHHTAPHRITSSIPSIGNNSLPNNTYPPPYPAKSTHPPVPPHTLLTHSCMHAIQKPTFCRINCM